MAAKLSVIIPCRDAIDDLRACVHAAREAADEIVIADSGSTDGTLELAHELAASLPNCRVIAGPWGGYAAFKNWAIPQATHPWVLIVDVDERLTTPLGEEIRATIAEAPEDIDGYWLRFRCFFLGHELRYSGYNSAALRLFRRDRCRYGERAVHEEIDVDRRRTGKLRERMLHYSIWSYDQYFEKWSKYTRLGAGILHTNGKRANAYSLTFRPLLRFIHLYLVRGGFRDGLLGLQMCVLTAFFNTFVKQARLWEMENAKPQPRESKASTPDRRAA